MQYMVPLFDISHKKYIMTKIKYILWQVIFEQGF
jgi:hypothetical protein